MKASRPDLKDQSCCPEPDFDAGLIEIRKPDYITKNVDRMLITSWEFLSDIAEIVSSSSFFNLNNLKN